MLNMPFSVRIIRDMNTFRWGESMGILSKLFGSKDEKEVKRLKKMVKTIVMVLHDLSNAFSYSDKICLMDEGEIVVHDTPQAVFDRKDIKQIFKISQEEVLVGKEGIKQYVFYLKKN